MVSNTILQLAAFTGGFILWYLDTLYNMVSIVSPPSKRQQHMPTRLHPLKMSYEGIEPLMMDLGIYSYSYKLTSRNTYTNREK